jgi:nitric oxide reductase NorD protein
MRGIAGHGLLASAIAGRKVSVQFLPHDNASDDALAFSDGQAIILPSQAAVETLWLAIAAQALLIAAGSFDPRLLRALIGRCESAHRYAALEVLRASRLFEHRLPWAFSRHPAVQDARPLTGSAAASLAFATGAEVLPAAPVWFGTIRPLIALRRALSESGPAGLIREPQAGKLNRDETREIGDDEDSESGAILRLFQNPFSSGGALARMLNEILGAGTSRGQRSAADQAGGGAELPVGRIEHSLRRGARAVLAKPPVELPVLDLSAENEALAYAEWDVHTRSYRRHWAFVQEVEPWRPDGPQDLGDLLQAPAREWRRQLADLGLDHEMHGRQRDGTDLDTGALIDCAIDLRSGHSPPSLNVYRASRRTRRDLAVAIVLDISGSTGEQQQAGPSVFAQQLQLAYQLGDALDALGDKVTMLGFNSWGRKLVRMVRLKDHDERWSARVGERLSLLEPAGYTRIGAAIRHGTRLLVHGMRLPNRLLVLVTDGIAYDQDYEYRYAEGDARKALEEARALGTAFVCLSVGAGTDIAKLAEVFGAAQVLAVDEVEQAIPRIRAVFRQALAAVSRRQLTQHAPAQ